MRVKNKARRKQDDGEETKRHGHEDDPQKRLLTRRPNSAWQPGKAHPSHTLSLDQSSYGLFVPILRSLELSTQYGVLA